MRDYMLGGLIPSEQYLVVVGTAVSGHILGHVPDQYHSSNSVTVQVLEAAAARLTGNQ